MTLRERIQEEMKDAMRARDQKRLGVIRLLLAAVKQREIDERITLDDDQVIAVLQKMIKQRRDSFAQYESANRKDLADQEAYEIQVLQEYLPTQLSDAEIESLIKHTITEVGANSSKDIGKVMGALKPKLQGRADTAEVSRKVKVLLESQ